MVRPYPYTIADSIGDDEIIVLGTRIRRGDLANNRGSMRADAAQAFVPSAFISRQPLMRHWPSAPRSRL